MKFINRINRKSVNKLPEQIILGEWFVRCESYDSKINNVRLSPNVDVYLWADPSNNIQYQKLEQIKIPSWQIYDEILKESIIYFYHQSNNFNINQDNWQNWLNLSPLVPEISSKIHLQNLEINLQKQWGHLETVCRRPRTYLKMETEKLAISRVKKVATGAIAHLASHSEDWYQRKFNSVKPNKLLCLVKEDLLNIYENQVTAKLIDHLLEYISYRLRELKLIKNELDETINFSNALHKIHWRNRERISLLWGKQFDAEKESLELEKTIQELKEKKRKLLGLMNSDLYKAIPKQTYVSMTLKKTNIFVNDQHYKYIDLLWRSWSKWKVKQIKNPSQVFEEYQRFCQGFEAFCLLLICKTFCENNFNNSQGLTFQPIFNQNFNFIGQDNRLFSFEGVFGKIDLFFSDHHTFYLRSKLINKDLCVIPLVVNLTGIKDEQEITYIVDELIKKIDQINDNVVFYLGNTEEQTLLSEKLQSKLNSLEFKNDNFIGIFPISPFEILSLERVSFAIKWWLQGNLYLSYPPTLEISASLSDDLLVHFKGCLIRENSQQLRVISAMDTQNIDRFNQQLISQINSFNSMGKTGRSPLEKLREIQKDNLPSKIQEKIKPFLVCPVCNHQEEFKHIEKLNNNSFQCSCSQCGSRWGTKHCGNCGKNYPFISPQGIEEKELNYNSFNVERVFGRDILSIPKIKHDGNVSFICCFCGFD